MLEGGGHWVPYEIVQGDDWKMGSELTSAGAELAAGFPHSQVGTHLPLLLTQPDAAYTLVPRSSHPFNLSLPGYKPPPPDQLHPSAFLPAPTQAGHKASLPDDLPADGETTDSTNAFLLKKGWMVSTST